MRLGSLVAGLALAWLTLVCGTAAAQPTCTEPNPAWLFCEGFESGELDSLVWQDANLVSGPSAFTVQSTTVASGSYAAESRSVSAVGGSVLWASHGFGDHPLWGNGQKVEDVYLSARVQLSDMTEGFWLLTMYSFESWDATYPEPNNFSPFYIQLRYRRTIDQNPRQLFGLLYRRTGATQVATTFDANVGAPVELEDDRWHEIVAHFRLNTPGANDGVLEVWVDSTRIMNYATVNYRDSYDLFGWNHVMMTTNVGHPAPQSIFYDDVIVSRSYPEPYDPGPRCGNGLIEGNEPCDDGNVSNRDDCLNGCIRAACGDGYVQQGVEGCDDRNTRNGDGCTNECQHSEAPPRRDDAVSSESSGCNVSHGWHESHLAWPLLFLAIFGPLRRARDRIDGQHP